MKTKTNLKAGAMEDGLMAIHNTVCGYVADAAGDYYWDAVDVIAAFRK